ncbi:MAG: lambda-exonuclease family protein [Bradymonadaceae bacterium]
MPLAEKFEQEIRPAAIDVGHARMLDAHAEDTDAWKAARRRGLGGSDAACVLGQQPYGCTRPELWRQKTGREESKVGNAAVRYGSIIEPYIREWLQRRSEDTTAIYGDYAGLAELPIQMAHPDYEWARANIDGVLLDREGSVYAGVEIKQSTHAYGGDKHEWPEGVQQYHYPQIQHYLWVTGLEQWRYVYLEVPADREFTRLVADQHVADVDDFWLWVVDRGELTTRTVERDEAYIKRLASVERDFWVDHVEADVEPHKWRPDGEIEVQDEELARLLDQYGKAKARIDASEAPDSAVESKEQAKEAIKQRAQSISAEHGDVKKIWVNDEDYVLWHGSGYWMAKPAERTVSSGSGGAPSPEDVDLGF